jgi:putative oxidoreductase
MPLLVRIYLATLFLESGFAKAAEPNDLIEFLVNHTLPFPHALAPTLTGIEIMGGFLLLLGLATRLTCIPLAFSMGLGFILLRWPDAESVADALLYPEALIGLLLLGLFLSGPGFLACDTWLAHRWKWRA